MSKVFSHNPKHPIGTCADCGEEMIYNVPRLGPNGGYIHKNTGNFGCGSEPSQLTVYTAPLTPVAQSFQARVKSWMLECFGELIAGDRTERNHRFLEEALELVQSCGCTRGEAHQLVDYTFDRKIGDRAQEVGGVMVTLAALCLAHGLDLHAEGEVELTRVWQCIETIRAKHADKPKHSPLPTKTLL